MERSVLLATSGIWLHDRTGLTGPIFAKERPLSWLAFLAVTSECNAALNSEVRSVGE